MIDEAVNLLGRLAHDKITGVKGVVESVSFDLYGCVQVVLKPTTPDKDGEPRQGLWYDVARIEVDHKSDRLMPVPFFDARSLPEYDRGPAEKPLRRA